MNVDHELIFCIVNAGYSQTVMEDAKEAGARGGTVIRARGTADPEAEQFFHLSVSPDKEILMILVESGIKDDVLKALHHVAGLDEESQGIAFSLPVDQAIGLSS
ncbi:MAG: P-II family nitrogen regulator [Lachnospiraceae bacterium]|nr:P-II family nitrogen regulator [Lachnospiraceae bacterium]